VKSVATMAQHEKAINEVIAAISDLQEDATVPKNVKEKVLAIIETLKNEELEISMRVDKARQILDEVAEDSNLQSYTRTQVWNVVSMLKGRRINLIFTYFQTITMAVADTEKKLLLYSFCKKVKYVTKTAVITATYLAEKNVESTW
jgi:uncharacterized protein (UPF0147 family)